MGKHVQKISPGETGKMLLGQKGLEVIIRCPACLERCKLCLATAGDYGLFLEIVVADPSLGLEGLDAKLKE